MTTLEALHRDLEQLVNQAPVQNCSFEEYIQRRSRLLEEIESTVPLATKEKKELSSDIGNLWGNVALCLAIKKQLEIFHPQHHLEIGQSYQQSFKEATWLLESLKESFSEEHFAAIWKVLYENLLQEGLPSNLVQEETNLILGRIFDTAQTKEFAAYCSQRGFAPEKVRCRRDFHVRYLAYARQLRRRYDIGVCLIQGGLYTAYLFHLAGLPSMDVEMKRRGNTSSWKPRENFDGEQLAGKRILILEDDVYTGRTLYRATYELFRYNPINIGVCCFHGVLNPEKLAPRFQKAMERVREFCYLKNEDYTLPPEEEAAMSLRLAQKLDRKYNIFRK